MSPGDFGSRICKTCVSAAAVAFGLRVCRRRLALARTHQRAPLSHGGAGIGREPAEGGRGARTKAPPGDGLKVHLA